MRRPSGSLRSLAAAAALLLCPALAHAEEAKSYAVGILPQAPALTMYQKWGPVLARLSELTGVTLRPKVYDSMRDFEEDFRSGEPDLLYSHPAMIAAAAQAQGYVPLVRGQRELVGWLFVRADSPFQSVTELRGKRIGFVGERTFCTVLLGRELGRKLAPDSFERSFHGSTRNVLRAVILGKVEAGASLDSALDQEDTEMRSLIRPLVTTDRFAPHPIAAHPRVPAEVREKLVAAVLQMNLAEPDRALLASVRMTDPVRADYQRDYKVLEVH